MQRKSSLLTVISVLSCFVISPATAVLGALFLESRYYYICAVTIIVFAIIPFFAFFENRKMKTSEIVTVAMITVICTVSRTAFIFLPQVKPMCAFVVVAGISFGANVGFVTGVLSVFVSNFVFGQGMHTAFQMLGMGLVGFICGLVFCGKKRSKKKLLVCAVAGLLCFVVYGFCVDTCSVFMMLTELSVGNVLSIYASGAPFNFIHALTTSVLLFFIMKPMDDKLSRLRIKYGIFSRIGEYEK